MYISFNHNKYILHVEHFISIPYPAPFPSTSTPPSSQGTTKMPTLPISEVSAVPEPSPNNSEPVPMTSNSQPLTFPYTPDPAPSPRREESTTSLPINTLRGNNSSDMGGVIGGVISALVIIFVASAAIGSVITTYAYRRRKTLMMRKLKRGVELDYVIYDALHGKHGCIMNGYCDFYFKFLGKKVKNESFYKRKHKTLNQHCLL